MEWTGLDWVETGAESKLNLFSLGEIFGLNNHFSI